MVCGATSRSRRDGGKEDEDEKKKKKKTTKRRRRKRPRKVANDHYTATIASLSTVCNVTCLRGLS